MDHVWIRIRASRVGCLRILFTVYRWTDERRKEAKESEKYLWTDERRRKASETWKRIRREQKEAKLEEDNKD